MRVPIVPHDMWHSSNTEDATYVNWIPDAYYALWTNEERGWVCDLWNGEEFTRLRERFIELSRRAGNLPQGSERNLLFDQIHQLEREALGLPPSLRR